MADQPIAVPVVRQRHRAVRGSANACAARLAQHERREAAPVEEQDRLLAGGERLARAPCAAAPDSIASPSGDARSQVDDLDVGHRPRRRRARSARAGRSRPSLGRARRSRGDGVAEPSTHDRAGALRAHQRDVAPVVAHALLLLERAVVLLVDDDRRRGRRAARTPPSARRRAIRDLAAAQPRPRRRAAPRRERPQCRTATRSPNRARNRAASCGVSEISGTSTSARLPARERRGDRAQVDLGLAAAGHAVQQERRVARSLRAPARWPRAPRACAVGQRRRRRRARVRASANGSRASSRVSRRTSPASTSARTRSPARASGPRAAPTSAIAPAAAMRVDRPRRASGAPERLRGAPLVERRASARSRRCARRASSTASSIVTRPRSTSARKRLGAGDRHRAGAWPSPRSDGAEQRARFAVELRQRQRLERAPTAPPPRALPSSVSASVRLRRAAPPGRQQQRACTSPGGASSSRRSTPPAPPGRADGAGASTTLDERLRRRAPASGGSSRHAPRPRPCARRTAPTRARRREPRASAGGTR